MDCSPEAQNRLTVTADALCGTPARRLAMRATFRPCSPSGMAQPRMTSSTSAASSAGTRASAAVIAAAARSSGRVWRSAPFGALPTGVRTAATMTASGMAYVLLTRLFAQQIDDGVGDLADVAVEQMIGAVDDDQLPRLVERAVEALHRLDRPQVIALAVNQEDRLAGTDHGVEVVARHRRCDGHEVGDARIHGADAGGDPRAERIADRPHRQPGVAGGRGVHRRLEVLAFAGPAGERALAGTRAAKRE